MQSSGERCSCLLLLLNWDSTAHVGTTPGFNRLSDGDAAAKVIPAVASVVAFASPKTTSLFYFIANAP